MEITHDGNMASARAGRLWLAAAGARAIEDTTWREYLGHASGSVSRDGPFHGVLFWTLKYGPSTSQRRMLTNEFATAVALQEQRRVALISESALVRGTITAINWFTRSHVAAFSPHSVERALDWLAEDVTFDRAQARHALDQIVRAVDVHVRKSAAS